MSCIILRGRWSNIIVVNMHAPCEDKSDDVKHNFYEELGRVFDQFPRYCDRPQPEFETRLRYSRGSI
jgi:hypothetical protein